MNIKATCGTATINKVKAIMNKCSSEVGAYDEITNYLDDEGEVRDMTTTYYHLVGGRNPEREKLLSEANEEVKSSFDYTLTVENYKEWIAAYENILKKLELTRPVKDNRRSREELLSIQKKREEEAVSVPPAVEIESGSVSVKQTDVSIVRNQARNGIEVRFQEKPSESVISFLKHKVRARWHWRGKFWYCKHSVDKWDLLTATLL